MTLQYDLYWSFRSPYSYLLVPRLIALEREYDVVANVRPVYPLAVRTPEFFDSRDPLWTPYLLRDVFREAAYLGLPFRWPRPDPVYQDRATGRYPPEQPYIHRLTHLGVLAAEQGRGLNYLREVSHVIWSGECPGWNEDEHLDGAAQRAGLDPGLLNEAVEREGERLAGVVEQSHSDQRAAGHWGVPLMTFGGEPFFGQDRFEQLTWRLRQDGLARR
ncbi:MAG TPA: DsbA family protein [Caulobacteraceae bacterium]|jgi:2-hydroxychromene-2-carboxylate isomerase|nr:DsbA family protein [Caulobacteraceae bacterium]